MSRRHVEKTRICLGTSSFRQPQARGGNSIFGWYGGCGTLLSQHLLLHGRTSQPSRDDFVPPVSIGHAVSLQRPRPRPRSHQGTAKVGLGRSGSSI